MEQKRGEETREEEKEIKQNSKEENRGGKDAGK